MPLSRRELLRLASQGTGEQPDPTPVHIPGKSDAPLTLRDEMRRFIRDELSKQVREESGAGTFEEEDDFEEDDPSADLLSPYTVIELPDDEATGYIVQEDPETPPAEPPLPASAGAEPEEK